MDMPPRSSSEDLGAQAFGRVQQELIELRNQRDRQIGQLMRLNRLSDLLLLDLERDQVAATFAEAIVDVLEIGVGALWLLEDDQPPQSRFAVCGMRIPEASWARLGATLLEAFPAQSPRAARPLPAALLSGWPGPSLEDAIACRCIGRDGRVRALLLAANCRTPAVMAENLSQESLQVLSLLAEKLAVHLDQLSDRQVIANQMRLLEQSQDRLAAVLKGSNDGWWDLDLIENTCFLSSRWGQMLGEPDPGPQIQGGFWRERIHPADRQQFDWLFEQLLQGRSEILETELRLRCHDGGFLSVLIRGTVDRFDDGTARRFAGSMQDLSERKRYESLVHRLAFYDSLTELPNRRLLQEHLQELTRTGQLKAAHAPRKFALMMLDLDHFKSLNDSHGHSAGDQMLCAVARRLQACVSRQDMVARIGGDEFVILLEQLGAAQDEAARHCQAVAQTIVRAMDTPIQIACGSIRQGISIGLVVPGTLSVTADQLLHQADLALYAAKASGRNRWFLFQEDMQRRIDLRSRLEQTLREGLDHDQFQCAYQLQVDAQGRPIACETLLRWHGTNSDISPSQFIPVAQESGLMDELGDQMLAHVLRDLQRWQPLGLPSGFHVAVNFSTPEFLRHDFVERVVARLRDSGVEGHRLRIEITEDSVLSDLAAAAERMRLLMEHGISFSLDDFGTGYSSFAYLRYLPVVEVKIDQGFVRRFLHHPQDAAIVRAILELGRSLDLAVVAEGVESEVQWQALQQVGCRLFQGYLFDRPCLEAEQPLLQRIAALSPDAHQTGAQAASAAPGVSLNPEPGEGPSPDVV